MKFRLLEGTHAEQVGWRLADGKVVERLDQIPVQMRDNAVMEVRRWQVIYDKKGQVLNQPVIETKSNLSERFDFNPGYPKKFQRLPDDWVEPEPLVSDATAAVEGLSPTEIQTLRELLAKSGNAAAAAQAAQAGFQHATTPPVPQAGARTLETMNYAELKKWAEEEEVDLKGAKTKDEALKALKTAGVLK